MGIEVLSLRHLLHEAFLGVLEPSHQTFPLQAQAVVPLCHLSKDSRQQLVNWTSDYINIKLQKTGYTRKSPQLFGAPKMQMSDSWNNLQDSFPQRRVSIRNKTSLSIRPLLHHF